MITIFLCTIFIVEFGRRSQNLFDEIIIELKKYKKLFYLIGEEIILIKDCGVIVVWNVIENFYNYFVLKK